ncbi:hypothetical protein FACS189452_08480 [Bacteroidia bacterium]|nr:hypothetical protein FACS189452_08480 [Bacteroidia bacterium]
MKHTFAHKLTVSFCLILILFSVGVVVFEQRQAKKYKTETMDERLDGYVEIIRQYLRYYSYQNAQEMDTLLSFFSENLRLTVIDDTGKVLFDNALKNIVQIENHFNRPEIKAAEKNGKGSDIRLSASTHKEYLYYAKKLDNKYIRVALPYDIQVRRFLQPDNAFLYSLLILFVIGLLFIYATSYHYGKIIKQLRDYSYSINHNIPTNIPHFSNDEIGEVGKQIAEDHKTLKQELTGNIAHELRTPVTGIRGYLETILDNKLDREKEHEFVAKAHEQILTLSELIHDMSLLAKITESPGSFQFKPVVIQQIINKVKTDLHEALNAKDIVIHSAIQPDLVVLGNENLLYSAFTFSMPILSILSIAVVISVNLSGAFINSAIPPNTLRLLIFSVTLMFNFLYTSSIICTNSTSLSNDTEPTTSASH